MAPDINQLPPSPRPSGPPSVTTSRTSSRRASQLMGPPPLPITSPVPHHAQVASSSLSNTGPTSMPSNVDNTGVGGGPGPMRHPRPLTAAELHLQLEKEQEMAVNRLTRELSLLRAQQSASVVSNTSSTSATQSETESQQTSTSNIHLLSGPTQPPPSSRRHHRSSSSTSTRSIHTPAHDTYSLVNYPFPTETTPSRLEELTLHRAELDAAKRENEALRRRVRELERLVHSRRTSTASTASEQGRGRGRTESESTNASISVTRRRNSERDEGDSILVGESAESVGVGGGSEA
jgi:hypothetical protein